MPTSTLSEASARTYSANTQGISAREKVDFWRDAVCGNVAELDFCPVGADSFDASITGTVLADFTVSHIEGSAHAAIHLATGSIDVKDKDRLVFNFVLAGQMKTEQDGRSVIVEAGDGTVCDAARPYVVQFDKPFDIACISLQRDKLPQRFADLRRVTAMSFAETSQLCPIVMGYLSGLVQAPTLNGVSSDRISHNFTELLGAMVDEATQHSPLHLSEYRRSVLLRIKDYIDRNLTDFDLDSRSVSIALKLSPRYINQLLEAEGTSLSRYIWRRRLERASFDLRNPNLGARSISTIAMANGFNDLSHFSKVFRQRYDKSPRQYRG